MTHRLALKSQRQIPAVFLQMMLQSTIQKQIAGRVFPEKSMMLVNTLLVIQEGRLLQRRVEQMVRNCLQHRVEKGSTVAQLDLNLRHLRLEH